jgi:hypothetical protein
MNAVAGRLAFPAPSATLVVADRALEVFPGSSLSVGQARCDKRCAFAPSEGSLVTFHLSFRALAAQPELLAASEEASSSSSHGVRSLCTPLSCDLPCVHSRKPKLPSARTCQGPGSRSVLVVSLHLDGFLHTGAAGLLHPADDSGVRRVSGSGSRWHPEVLPERSPPSPRRESYPSKSSPHQQPHRITAAVALLPLLHALRVWTARRIAERGCPHRVAEASGSSLRPPRPKPGLTQCACADRGRCWRHCRWPRPVAVCSRSSGEARELSRLSGSRSCRSDPGGSGAHPLRPRSPGMASTCRDGGRWSRRAGALPW